MALFRVPKLFCFRSSTCRSCTFHKRLHFSTLSLSQWEKGMSLARSLNAFITELDDASINQSIDRAEGSVSASPISNKSPETCKAAAESTNPSKNLSGLRFAVKDNYCTKNVRTTCGSKMLENFYPAYTATVVQRLLDAGGRFVGKTNMDEFAMGSGSVDSIFGPVKNPWDSRCIAGGSSGGSAVAVATRAVDFALGSDTGGSVRNPASYCGVVGFKPSYGTVSRHGLISLLNSTDVPAIFSRTVSDTRTVFNVISGWDAKDSTTFKEPFPAPKKQLKQHSPDMPKLRIGIPREFLLPELFDHNLMPYKDTAKRLELLGADVRPISLPHSEYANACYAVLCACDVASNMARYDGIEFGHRSQAVAATNGSDALYAATRHEGFNEVVRGRILAGNYFLLKRNYSAYFEQAAKVRRLIADDFQRVFESGQADVILAPVTLGEAPELDAFCGLDNRTQQELQDWFTVGASLAGLPAISLPIGLSVKRQLPVGMQLIAPFREDLFLLDVAERLETSLRTQFGVDDGRPILENYWNDRSQTYGCV